MMDNNDILVKDVLQGEGLTSNDEGKSSKNNDIEIINKDEGGSCNNGMDKLRKGVKPLYTLWLQILQSWCFWLRLVLA